MTLFICPYSNCKLMSYACEFYIHQAYNLNDDDEPHNQIEEKLAFTSLVIKCLKSSTILFHQEHDNFDLKMYIVQDKIVQLSHLHTYGHLVDIKSFWSETPP